MYRTFRLMNPYVVAAENSDLELQKYQNMGIGLRIAANIIGVPIGLAISIMLWSTAIALLVIAYTFLGLINTVVILVLILIYGIVLPVLIITISIANIILEILSAFRPQNGIQVIQPNNGTWCRHRG